MSSVVIIAMGKMNDKCKDESKQQESTKSGKESKMPLFASKHLPSYEMLVNNAWFLPFLENQIPLICMIVWVDCGDSIVKWKCHSSITSQIEADHLGWETGCYDVTQSADSLHTSNI